MVVLVEAAEKIQCRDESDLRRDEGSVYIHFVWEMTFPDVAGLTPVLSAGETMRLGEERSSLRVPFCRHDGG